MSAVPPYAPVSGYNRNVNLDVERKLYDSPKEGELYESLGELYSIIITLDKLEKAYLKDTITHNEYTPVCLRLLAQYNGILKNEEVSNAFVDLETFKKKYGMNYVRATQRLNIGVPATVEHSVETSAVFKAISEAPLTGSGTPASNNGANGGGSGGLKGASARAVAEATGNFITTMDGLKLNFRAKDQLHPLLSELITSVNKVTNNEFEGRGKLVQWLITLNQMKINEELTDDQARQLLFDLDTCYKAFYTSLE